MRSCPGLVILGGLLPILSRLPSTATNLVSDAVVRFVLGQPVSRLPAPTRTSFPDKQRPAHSQTLPARDHRDAFCHFVSEILPASEEKSSVLNGMAR